MYIIFIIYGKCIHVNIFIHKYVKNYLVINVRVDVECVYVGVGVCVCTRV